MTANPAGLSVLRVVPSPKTPLDIRLFARGAKTFGKAVSISTANLHRVGLLPSDEAVEIVRDIPYARRGGKQSFDLYLPRRRERSTVMPYAVFVHGGGFVMGDRKMGALMGRRLASRGIPVVAPGYRLCPDVSPHDQLDDLSRALEVIGASADRYGLDAGRYALIGESAGAHLAMRLLAERSEIARPRAAVGFYGAYDLAAYRRRDSRVFDAFLRTVGRGGDIDALVRAHHAVRELPFTDMPVLLVHGDADRFVPVQNSIALARRLEGQGVSVQLSIYPGAGHGFNYQTLFSPQHTAASFLELERFFARHVPAPLEAP